MKPTRPRIEAGSHRVLYLSGRRRAGSLAMFGWTNLCCMCTTSARHPMPVRGHATPSQDRPCNSSLFWYRRQRRRLTPMDLFSRCLPHVWLFARSMSLPLPSYKRPMAARTTFKNLISSYLSCLLLPIPSLLVRVRVRTPRLSQKPPRPLRLDLPPIS